MNIIHLLFLVLTFVAAAWRDWANTPAAAADITTITIPAGTMTITAATITMTAATLTITVPSRAWPPARSYSCPACPAPPASLPTDEFQGRVPALEALATSSSLDWALILVTAFITLVAILFTAWLLWGLYIRDVPAMVEG
ncbi:hypothetical protein KVR01_007256 [Diaporthe batatas]|uniref:uncharacterized protein n=1 Tax=Diaporthe batatas TaxID=748121 RepID=UPI001D03A4B8|nr:uncharacterized protein KVR01_007256 [Diaporthe batatas]KAG8162778.1 hypothetical protein KVR01_007256 [Diaporthe batatas]